MRQQSKSAAWLAAGVILAAGGLVAACDKSAQNGDGTTAQGAAGTAAYTPNGQVVPVGGDTEKLDSPEITATAPAATGATPADGAAGAQGANPATAPAATNGAADTSNVAR